MNKNKKIGVAVVGIVVLIAVFYGGVSYGKSQIPAKGGTGAYAGRNSALGAGGTRGGGFTSGQITAKDAQSITVQLMSGGSASATQGGGSKIIFFDSNTKVSKQAVGTTNDLTVGTQVSITGTPNSDGSINATTVQIRPNTPPVLK